MNRYRDSQLQVAEKNSSLFNLTPKIWKSDQITTQRRKSIWIRNVQAHIVSRRHLFRQGTSFARAPRYWGVNDMNEFR